MSKKKKAKLVETEILAQMNTKQLIGYLTRLRKCEESFEKSDMENNLDLTDEETIYFKQTAKWETAYKRVKGILSERENIDYWKRK